MWRQWRDRSEGINRALPPPARGRAAWRMASSNGERPPQGEEDAAAVAGSIGGYESLHRLLDSNLFPDLSKIDLGVNKGRQKIKATSIDNSVDPPENCKPKEFITCEGTIVCIENEAPEGLPRGILNGFQKACHVEY